MTATPHLELRNVAFTYPNGRPVLQDITLSIPHGARWSIVGPNGSGKSTLLRVMAGLLKPEHGDVLLADSSLRDLRARARARRIAFLPQQVAPSFGFTARQVVAMGRYPHVAGLGLESHHDWELIDEAMRWTETTALARRTLETLSGGERQRVLLAAALVQAADLLLLDEPTTALDVNHQIGIHRLLNRLSEERRWTIVSVTHDLNLAGHFSDQVVMMHAGRIVALGPPAEVLTCERVAAVYGVGMQSLHHPTTGAPVLVPTGFDASDTEGRHADPS